MKRPPRDGPIVKEMNKEAKAILKEKLKGQQIQVVREFGQPHRGGKIPPVKRADMMRTLIERPDIKGIEFARKYGYKPDPRNENAAPSCVYEMINVLKNEIAEYKLPEAEEILRADLVVVAHGLKELLHRLKEEPESMSVMDLNATVDRSFKRARLLQGKSTNNVAVNIKEIGAMKEEDLDAFLNNAITVRQIQPKGE